LIALIAFYLFATVTIASAVAVIFARNPVHSVLWLILAFFNAAGLMLIIGAEFIAMLLVIVYVGAVAVLFLFVVMMLDIDFAELRSGFTKNLPMDAGAGDAAYLRAVEDVVVRVIDSYRPSTILLSSGFDAHRRDPLGGMELDAEGYAWMTRSLLAALQRGPGHRIAFLLEGGYDLTGLRESVQHTLGALFDAPPEIESTEALSARHEHELAAALRAQKPFWHL